MKITLLILLFLVGCALIVRPVDLLSRPYCEPLNDYVWRCRDDRGQVWRCVHDGGRWACRPLAFR